MDTLLLVQFHRVQDGISAVLARVDARHGIT